MIVRQLDQNSGKLPDIETPCGFDMIAGDGVQPYGTGKVSDFIVSLKLDIRKHLGLDYQGSLVFPNPGDGVILYPVRLRFRVSELRLPAEAPMGGYQSSFAWNVLFGSEPSKYADTAAPRVPGPKDRNFEDDNYFIRVRTKKSEDGTVSGIYGKIHGQIKLGIGAINDISVPADAKPSVQLLYYLNPDESRHLEWDKVHNLANDSEVPREP